MKPASRAPVYAALYPALAEIARKQGYALLIHGTMQRDFDLVACPWVDGAASPEALVRAMAEAVAARFGGEPLVGYSMRSAPRPHGRVGWSIMLEMSEDGSASDAYIDLSVMPLAPTKETTTGCCHGCDAGLPCCASEEPSHQPPAPPPPEPRDA